MHNRRLQGCIQTIRLIGTGRFHWRLWSPVIMGIIVAFTNRIISLEIFETETFLEAEFTSRLLLGGAGIAPLLAISSWFSTDSTRSRLLVDGSLASYLTLPLQRMEKTCFLIVRTALIPFLTMFTAAVVTLLILDQIFLEQSLLGPAFRMLPFAAGMSICLAALGWSGSWMHISTKVFGENISVRSHNGLGMLSLLLLLALPFPALLSGPALVLVSIAPYLLCMLWLDSQYSELQLEGCTENLNNTKQRNDIATKHGWLLSAILSTRAGQSRTGRWLLLHIYESSSIAERIENKDGRKAIYTCFGYLLPSAIGILIWYILFFRKLPPSGGTIGALVVFYVVCVLIIVRHIQTDSNGSSRAILPVHWSQRGILRILRSSILPIAHIGLITPVSAGLILSTYRLFPFSAGTAIGPHIGWMGLTGSSLIMALQILPAGILWIHITEIILQLCALAASRSGFFRLAGILATSWESRIISIMPAFIVLAEGPGFLIAADKPLLLLLALISIAPLLLVEKMSDRYMQRAHL